MMLMPITAGGCQARRLHPSMEGTAMTKEFGDTRRGGGSVWRFVGWGTAALLLLLPALAGAPWTAFDFVFAGALLGGVGLAFELVVRKRSGLSYRLGAAVALVTALLTIWANGAVGMIGSEDDPLNLVFGGVLLLALIGAILARLQAGGMMRAMVATAVAQVAAGSLGLSSDPLGAGLSMAFAGFWLLAAALFRNAVREPAPAVRQNAHGPTR